MLLSIIVPAFNEEKRLPKTLTEISDYLKNQKYDSEIIVVDGGSKDRTREIAGEMASVIGNLKLIEIKGLGKGHAVRVGMLEAKGDYKIFTDADNSTSIDQVEKMWPEFAAGYEVVIGSRDIKGAILNPAQPWLRKTILGDGFKLYRKIIIGLWGIEDTQCGFKGFTKKAANDIFLKAKLNDFAFDPEILIIANKLGYKIKEIPIIWVNDLDSKVRFKSIVKMALDLLKLRWDMVTGKI